jgi:hypothetical protein
MRGSRPRDWRDAAAAWNGRGGRYSRAVEGGEPAGGRVVAVHETRREGATVGPLRLECGPVVATIVIEGIPIADLTPGARLTLGATALVALAAPDPPSLVPDRRARGGLMEVDGEAVVAADVLEPGLVAPGDGVTLEAVTVPLTDVLDLHSFRPEETAKVVTDYLAEAHRAGFEEVRIVHGRGRGVQRAVVQRLLTGVSTVAAFADAPPTRGGWGATIVRLRRAEDVPPA